MLIRSEIFFSRCRLTNKWILCISNSGNTLSQRKSETVALYHPFSWRNSAAKIFQPAWSKAAGRADPSIIHPSSSICRLTQSAAAHPALPRLGKTSRVNAMQKPQQAVLHSHLGHVGYSSRGWQSSAREATSISAHRGVNLSLVSGCSNCFGTAASWILHSCTPVRARVLGLFPKPGN